MALNVKLNLKSLLSLRCQIGCVSNYFATTSTEIEVVDPSSAQEQPVFVIQEETIPEDDLLKIRDKSRLKSRERRILFGEKPYDEPTTPHHETQIWQRKLFGRYGLEAVDKPIEFLWPNEEQIADQKEYERVAYPLSLRECWTKIEEEKRAKEAGIRARDEAVACKMANMQVQIQALRNKIATKAAEMEAAKNRKQLLMEEVRSHFGFKIDFKDERFKELLAQKEKEEKKKKKEAKKQKQQDRIVAYVMQTQGDLKKKTEMKENTEEES